MKISGEESCHMTPSVFCRGETSKQPQNSRGRENLVTGDAVAYLKAVREMYTEKKGNYEEFLEVMKDFKTQKISTAGVVTRVKKLFKGHRDLILGFNTFLPEGFQITLPMEDDHSDEKPVEIEEALCFINKIKARFQHEEHVYKLFVEILNQYRMQKISSSRVLEEVGHLFQEHQDLLEEFNHFHPQAPTQSGTARKSVPGSFGLKDEKGSSVSMMRHIHGKERIASSHADHPNHDCQSSSLKREREQKKRFEKEKDRNMGNTCILSQKRKPSSRSDDLNAVFSQEEGGAEGFRLQTKLTFSFENRTAVNGNVSKRVKAEGKERVRRCDRDEHEKDMNNKRDREKKRERLDRISPSIPKDSASVSNCKDKLVNTAPSELDLSSCRKGTPSYRLLPKNYQLPSSSYRKEHDAAVLNDVWVSVTCGSEEYSFKHMQKNQYEENLFRCEDDRYELDMLLETTKMTARHVEELLETIKPHGHTQIEDHLNVLDLRCIERIYEDHTLDMIDLLRNNPTETLPIILARLKQKHDEWAKGRNLMNIIWAEVYAKNHWRSLDHRSLHFKRQDQKNLSTKALLAEIRDITVKKHEEDDVLPEAAACIEELIIPKLEFEYADPDVHEDLYKIMKYSCSELCPTVEQLDKVMMIWTSFLEPMLGVPPRPHAEEDTQEMVKLTNDAPKVSAAEGDYIPGADGISNSKPLNSFGNHIDMPKAYEDASRSRLVNGYAPVRQDGFDEIDLVIHKRDSFGITPQTVKIKNDAPLSNKMSEVNTICACSELGKNSILVDTVNEECIAENKPNKVITKDEDLVASSNLKVGRGHNLDAKDDMQEKAQQSTENSKTVSEAAVNVSGSESGVADECAPENHKEEEDEKHDDATDGNDMGTEGKIVVVKPLMKFVSPVLHDQNSKRSRVFYGNNSFYVLFRLHQILYVRILLAKMNSASGEKKSGSLANADPLEQYAKFMGVLYSLLDGTIDNSEFEDNCQALIGIQKSYILFTLDKLIFKLVKQLQSIASDEMDDKLLQLHAYEKSRAPMKFVDLVYRENAFVLLHADNIYRFECSSSPTRLSIQMMDPTCGRPRDAVAAMDPGFAAYLNNEYLSVNPITKELRPVFLKRNIQKYPSAGGHSSVSQEMGGLQSVNGLECEISCNNSKAKYVSNNKDVLYCTRTKRISAPVG